VTTPRPRARAALVALLFSASVLTPALADAGPRHSSSAAPSSSAAAPPATSAAPIATRPSPSESASTSPPPTLAPGAARAIPVWAYYYIWFDPSSWERAKSDTPLLGTYSSDERNIMRKHIELAKAAGIDGFLVSWKDTPTLTDRLERLAAIAKEMDFHLGIVYQGLDFARRPIEVRQVCADLKSFADAHASDPVFRLNGPRPIVVWTGTDQFSSADQEKCVAPVRDRLTVLASSRSVKEWQRASKTFAGSAYYWSSVNPQKDWYPRKLAEMGDAVHAGGGLWVAPAAPGFDARLVGGQTVVPRDDGRTLTRELAVAVQSAADAIGLISWNEFTENSQVEPSKKYGSTALQAVSQFTGSGAEVPQLDSSAPAQQPAAAGFNGVAALIIMGAVLGLLLIWSLWRRDPAPPVVHGPRSPGGDERDARHGHGEGNGIRRNPVTGPDAPREGRGQGPDAEKRGDADRPDGPGGGPGTGEE